MSASGGKGKNNESALSANYLLNDTRKSQHGGGGLRSLDLGGMRNPVDTGGCKF